MGFVISNSTHFLAGMTKVTATSSIDTPNALSPTPTNLVMELVILAHTTKFYVALMEEIVWLMRMSVSALESKVPILQSLGMECAMPAITTKLGVGMERIAWNSMPSILRVERNTTVL
jgi:hypothetical protein